MSIEMALSLLKRDRNNRCQDKNKRPRQETRLLCPILQKPGGLYRRVLGGAFLSFMLDASVSMASYLSDKLAQIAKTPITHDVTENVVSFIFSFCFVFGNLTNNAQHK